jgi:ATP-dependent DNA helicase RecQ
VRAARIDSTNTEEWGEIVERLSNDEVDLLLVSPERLTNPRFADELLPTLTARCGLLVIDEAHCIRDWGHDFRPDYRRIRDLLTSLPEGTPVLATTATANARVVTDVVEQLSAGGRDADGAGGRDVLTLRGPLARASLRLGVMPLGAPEQRLAWLIAHLGDLEGSGIVYALTVAAAVAVAAALKEAGHQVAAYTGRTDPADRIRLEAALRDNEVKALVATSALGMGFDKPDLGFVIHLGAPSSPVAYYQQVGRAGRATERADVLLMPGPEDRDIWRYFASASMPKQEQADAVVRALTESTRPLSTVALETIVDVRRTRLELLLKVLDVDGAVQRVQGGWTATGMPWEYDEERYARVTAAREREQQLMIDYERTDTCRMAFLQQCLDDETAALCGRCDTCAGPWFDATLPEAALRTATARLERPGVVIEPRAQWPSGMDRLGVPRKGRIGAASAMEPGRALARLSDLGWGQRLRQLLREEDAEVPEQVVRACVAVLADWEWAQRPAAVVAVPSRRRPLIVRSLAEQLAQLGRLPLLGELDLVDGGPTGEAGGNSAFRLAGVWGRLAVGTELQSRLSAIPGPVLLVDDVADSRWTLTCAAEVLREAGAPAVLPFTLALEA